jgi:hypothetical protein
VIVVSVEIVAALYLPGDLTETAERVLLRDPAWASPMFWRAMLPYHLQVPLRAGILRPETVASIIEEAPRLFLSREFPSPLADNMKFLMRSECSALIAPYLDLATGLDVPLVTTDQEAIRSFPDVAIAAADFAAGLN